ncbi:MAG: NADH-quinone oxidoreductase subunit N, partial [Chloroflexi bacterium]
MPPGTDLTYTWSQAQADLGQIAPVVALTGFFLLALVTDLIIPRPRRGGVIAMFAVVGFAYSLGTALYRWRYATGGYAYHKFATGDDFALFFEILFASLGILTVAVSHSYLKRRGFLESEFHILVMAAVIGMMVLASATSLVTVFLGLELLSIALYIMCGFARTDFKSQEAAAKYLLVGGFASAFVLYGMALVYGGSGTTVIPDIAQRLSTSAGTNPLLLLGIVLMGVGFAFKVSAAPFHMWTPDVYQGAPIPVTAFMSVGTKAAAFAMIVRVFSAGLPHLAPEWQTLLAVVAVTSMVVGNLMAIVQTSLKRLLAYS